MSLAPLCNLRPPRARCAVRALAPALALALLWWCGPGGAADGAPGAEPLPVFVSVVPLQTFVERIGGDQVRVRSMVAPGQNPHTYEPTPKQVADLAGAVLYVRVGVPLEDAWLPRIRATNPGLRVLDVRDGLALRPNDQVQPAPGPEGDADHGDGHGDHDDEHGHDHGALDTHVWTSPPLVKSMGAAIRAALSDLRPGQAALFAANDARFAADLDALDAEIRDRLKPLQVRRFLVFHPAWGYYADTYGLTQVAIEFEGKEPGPRALAGLIDAARAAGVRAVLTQPQFSPRAAQQVAAAIGGRVESVDPLSADYFGALRRVTGVIAGGQTP
ncbi:zinc ABC transporter substrate-binding protein [uncultured Thiodictyon sp.]|uniref:metal ABC transporter solute-binding protein, Zn/Mn family n=1 Tax=uncultured Thiodictyon sp. TaxID=1846217 RepID=UPI0025EBBAC5|nr:zinc ABC transporter substrate-binding protein [uncultured Thiodictyon sp.]